MTMLKLARFRKSNGLYGGFERRRYKRVSCELPLRIQSAGTEERGGTQIGKLKNISQGGMLFKAVNPLTRKMSVLIESDIKALSKLVKIEKELTTIGGKILARVVRTHLNLNNGLFEIGVEFIRTNTREKKLEQESVKEISQKLETKHPRLDKRRFGFL